MLTQYRVNASKSMGNREDRSSTRRKWVFYYDGACGFCTAVVRTLRRGDFFHLITWIPYQSLDQPPPGLSWDDLDLGIYLDTGRDHHHRGFYAFRMLTLRLLPLIPLAPLFWFPGVSLAGAPVYRWVARNRYRFSGCRIPGIWGGRHTKPPA